MPDGEIEWTSIEEMLSIRPSVTAEIQQSEDQLSVLYKNGDIIFINNNSHFYMSYDSLQPVRIIAITTNPPFSFYEVTTVEGFVRRLFASDGGIVGLVSDRLAAAFLAAEQTCTAFWEVMNSETND